MLEQTMDRQKLSRMMDRSERMYLLDKRRRQRRPCSVPLIYRGGVKPNAAARFAAFALGT